MEYIDEKFKDEKPEITVETIKQKLKSLGIEITENWNDSKIENCNSLRIVAQGGNPGTNGKGITKEFARASAYGEFIERLQSGLFFYKYQSLEDDSAVFLHSFAPDKKFFTKSELLENNSDWMEPICKAYGLTKETIANACEIFNGSPQIVTLPYYSLFEGKYVYLPTRFVEYIYTANGCCVGNTREEAWVHALSEIFERHSNMEVIKSGKPVPAIPREKTKKFKVASKILKAIDESGNFDVQILDYSCGTGFPVVGTRIIDKRTGGYLVNVGADPVFEIALERSLTEIFQGRNIDNFTSIQPGRILNNINEIKLVDNMFNQVETSNGLFTYEFFLDGAGKDSIDDFEDNSHKTNKQLLDFVLNKYKQLGLNVYVRNNSFLGFPCYKFVVPGYSDIRIEQLKEPIPSYYFASRAAATLRNIKSASTAQLSELLMYRNMISGYISKQNNFTYLSGLPFNKNKSYLPSLSFAYASLKTGNNKLLDLYLDEAIFFAQSEKEVSEYLSAVKNWICMTRNKLSKQDAIKIIRKFNSPSASKMLEKNLNDDTLFDTLLIECIRDCENCKHKQICNYQNIKTIMGNIGKEYAKFTHGQDKENFAF